MNKRPILKINWEDITEIPGWFPKDVDVEELISPAQILTVGIKIKETKKHLYLANTEGYTDDFNQWGTLIVIPKGCITKIQVLGYVKK